MSLTDRKTPRAQQLPLSFGHEPATGRDDLVISDPVSAAASIVDRWPDWPSPVVIITGPPGSGKSHLAEVWRRASAAAQIMDGGSADPVLLAEQGAVLLEDADRSALDETTLFHVINAVKSHGTSLMITARAWPSAWNVRLPDLASRLKAATVVEIGAPDDALLTQILFKLFADRQLLIDEKLAAYIVSRMERSLDAAQQIVDRLDRLALARGVKISRTLAGEILNEMSADGC
ncbi:hypothetical protein JJB09_04530 [Rhizobium sp. KVB221]|uniref:Chromosomal replication initiator protein DnaA domain-containing protein n=1 Tax=Rhizobium setariae TaxID=2801340 RepID=A0A937CP12_9HYPH|nr:DnaA regulatory inactivator HdaA [Rhizobium setariae]MBL0371287.1 hypothetical protein [Rhizobium setariae]